MDVSGPKKLHLVWPHASGILDFATTRNVERITPGKAGVVMMGMISKLTGRSLAIARLAPAAAMPGKQLEVAGKSGTSPATAAPLPFDDPEKKKRTAIG